VSTAGKAARGVTVWGAGVGGRAWRQRSQGHLTKLRSREAPFLDSSVCRRALRAFGVSSASVSERAAEVKLQPLSEELEV
jgi:hypothetical protein